MDEERRERIAQEQFDAVEQKWQGSSQDRQERKPGWTAYLIFCNATIVLGTGFAFGYNLAVVNGPFLVLNQWLNETFAKEDGRILSKDELNTQWSLAVSLYLIGGAVGSTWFPSKLAGVLGKRNALLIGAAIGVIGEAILFISRYTGSYFPFMIGRAVVGFQGGLGMVIAPGLLNEHAPPQLRGACGTLFSIGISIGNEIANLLGLPYLLGTEDYWHFLFLVMTGLYMLHACSLFFVVESPRWLIEQRRYEDAVKAFEKLRNSDDQSVMLEFECDKRVSEAESIEPPVSFKTVLRNRHLWWPMFIVINLHIANEMTGLLAVLIYATLVMNGAGLDHGLAAVANFGLTFSLIIGEIICAFLVDRFGRRHLMLAGTMSMTLVNAFLVIVLSFNNFQLSIVGFALYLLAFGIGPGPIAFFMPAEKFNHNARPLALAVATFTNWVASIVVCFIFPVMQLKIGCYSFLPFAVISALEFVFFLLFLPETTHSMANYSQEIFVDGNSLLQLNWHLRYKRVHLPHLPNHHHHQQTNGDTKPAA